MSSAYYQQELKEDESLLRRGLNRARRGVASLISADETDPDPEAFSRSSTEIYSSAVDIDRPDAETQEYWTEYRQNPIITTQIDGVTQDVFEAGYWVTADSAETEREIVEFLDNIGVKGGQVHRSFAELGQMAVTQYLVRGTFLGEKVTDDQERHVAINPVNPTTVEMYTKPGKGILVKPDHLDSETDGLIKQTPAGETAAYVQFDERLVRWKERKERRFTRDEMLHWARKPDIGQIRGNSVIEPVFDRSQALREKLQDNDLAIAMKAWPMVLFQMGTPEHPWTNDEMEDFLEPYTEEELGPGMFQGVPGDVEIHEFAGETADINDHVMTDVDVIISGLPGQNEHLGAFLDAGVQTPPAQQARYRKRIRSLRRDLENLFTPYLREVAESWGYDATGLELNIGRPGDEVPPEDIQGSIIRYKGKDDTDEDDGNKFGVGDYDVADDDTDDGGDNGGDAGGSADDDAPNMDVNIQDGRAKQASSAEQSSRARRSAVTQLGQAELSVDAQTDTAALADPRLVSTADLEDALSTEIATVLTEARENTCDIIELRYDGAAQPDGDAVRAEFHSQLGTKRRDGDLEAEARRVLTDTVEQTLETMAQQSHTPSIDASMDAEHRSVVAGMVETVLDDLQDIGTEIASTVRTQADRTSDERDSTVIADRIGDVWDDGTIEARAALLARMRCNECVNRVKLRQYRDADEVVGVSIISACGENTHRLTADLAGCDGGDPAVAYFDSDDELSAQFEAATSVDLSTGFDPLPTTPPFHFGDRSELAPVTASDA